MGKRLDAAHTRIAELERSLSLAQGIIDQRDARIEVLQSEAQKLRARPAPRKAAPRKKAVKKGGE